MALKLTILSPASGAAALCAGRRPRWDGACARGGISQGLARRGQRAISILCTGSLVHAARTRRPVRIPEIGVTRRTVANGPERGG